MKNVLVLLGIQEIVGRMLGFVKLEYKFVILIILGAFVMERHMLLLKLKVVMG